MSHPTAASLEDRLRRCERVLEVGIGRRTGLARRLVGAGVTVIAIDRDPTVEPPGVRIIHDDVHALDPDRVAPIDAVYARRLPPELQRSTAALAEALSAPLWFTTLGFDPILIDAFPTTVAGTTVYTAVDAGPEKV